MIKGKKREALTPQNILHKVSSYDIYRFYVGNFKLNKAIPAPYRRDRNPSFCIRVSKTRELYHVDYGNVGFRGNAFQYVMQAFNLNFTEALEKINNDMGLGILSGQEHYQAIISQYEAPELIIKPPPHILVITRRMNSGELNYWNQYHLDSRDLEEEEVYGISQIYLNRRRLPLSNELRFAYKYGAFWKIYTPFAKNKKRKFFPNNVPNDHMEGLESLKGAEKGIITKSKKDRMVIKKIFPHVAAAQSENEVAINEENIKYIKEECKFPYIAFDNDEPGKKASLFYTQHYGFRHINVPDQYLEERITDFADLAKAYGLNTVTNYFLNKGIM